MDKGAWPQKITQHFAFLFQIEYFSQTAASDINLHQHKIYANKRVDDDCKA